MKNILIALAGILCLSGELIAQNTIIIKGTVKGDLQGHQKVFVYGRDIKSDSAIINNGSFELSIPYKEGILPLLYDEYDMKIKQGISPYPIVVDRPGVVVIKDIDITKGLSSGILSGMKSAVDYQQYTFQEADIYKQIRQQLKKKYGEGITPKSPEYEAYQQEMEVLRKEKMVPVIEHIIKSDPDSYTSAFILGSDAMELVDVDELERMFKMLSERGQQSKYGKSIADYLGGIKRSGIGQEVQHFTLNTPEEKPLSLQDLKGKYVVLDFWASWCGPCIKSFPHMKEIYKKYKSDRFEVFSISIDQSKADWLKALKVQQLPWLQALDTKNIALKSFAVTAIPTVYLIDPAGKIMMKEMGFDENGKGDIEKKLVELFGSK